MSDIESKQEQLVIDAGRPLSYMPQLDALRALAVGAVFISHFAPRIPLTGALGVRLFFVLSGFLITSILLRLRKSIDEGEQALRPLRTFYSRRFLRLFPALLLLVAILVALGYASLRSTWPWHLSYLSNIYFYRRGEWEGGVSPLWSLSVEEQFYLVWPLFIFFVPRKFHMPGACFVIAIALFWRFGASLVAHNPIRPYVLPFWSTDALGLGALLAMSAEDPIRARISRVRFITVSRNVGVPAFVGFLGLYITGRQGVLTSVFLYFAAALAFTWLVSAAAIGFKGIVGRAMTLPPLLYLGRISYGLYLYHTFAPFVVKQFLLKLGVPLNEIGMPIPVVDFMRAFSGQYATKLAALVAVVLYSLTAVGMATLSWYLWERPATTLRRFVRYPAELMGTRTVRRMSSAA